MYQSKKSCELTNERKTVIFENYRRKNMSKNSQAAQEMFLEGYNCAQAVLACCGRDYGLPHQTAINIAQAFGGGIGRTGNICGAVTGALMLIGFKCGIKNAKDVAAKQEAHRLAREFMERFRAHNGSIICCDLLGCDISTDKGMKEAHAKGLTTTICPKLVKDGAEIIEEVLGSGENT
jgi:C_GCAxxG_C_C family probable redox protein